MDPGPVVSGAGIDALGRPFVRTRKLRMILQIIAKSSRAPTRDNQNSHMSHGGGEGPSNDKDDTKMYGVSGGRLGVGASGGRGGGSSGAGVDGGGAAGDGREGGGGEGPSNVMVCTTGSETPTTVCWIASESSVVESARKRRATEFATV